jgi:predicted nucleotidyltransferase
MNLTEIIDELNRLIKEKFSDFQGCYLFGSRAKGNFAVDSDIDLVALFDNVSREKEMEIYGITSELDYKYDVILALLPSTLQELERNVIFYDEVVNKGVFYGAK